MELQSEPKKNTYTTNMKKCIYEWRDENRDKYNEYMREYSRKNKEKRKLYYEKTKISKAKKQEENKIKLKLLDDLLKNLNLSEAKNNLTKN
jgi:type III secretory pathway component EscR